MDSAQLVRNVAHDVDAADRRATADYRWRAAEFAQRKGAVGTSMHQLTNSTSCFLVACRFSFSARNDQEYVAIVLSAFRVSTSGVRVMNVSRRHVRNRSRKVNRCDVRFTFKSGELPSGGVHLLVQQASKDDAGDPYHCA